MMAVNTQVIQKSRKFQLLQILRAYAALLVVTTHASLVSQRDFGGQFLLSNTLQEGARIGVEIFFILSGFIHFYVHQKHFSHKEKLKSYFLKRIIRIYPIYWIVSLPLIPIYFIAPFLGNKDGDSGFIYIFKSLLLIPQEEFPLLSVGWTLTLELFFYVLIGILIWFRPKIARLIISILLIGTLIKFFVDISGGGWETKYRTGNSLFDLSFSTAFIFNRFNLSFFSGVLVSLLVVRNNLAGNAKKNYLIRWSWVVILLAATVLICLPPEMLGSISGGTITAGEANRILYYGPIVGIWITASIVSEMAFSLKIPRFLDYLGDASYSIFLLHYPALLAMGKACKFLELDQIIDYRFLMYTITIASVAFGVVLYTKVEKPVTRWLMLRVKR